jgi:hypothetical protein
MALMMLMLSLATDTQNGRFLRLLLMRLLVFARVMAGLDGLYADFSRPLYQRQE